MSAEPDLPNNEVTSSPHLLDSRDCRRPVTILLAEDEPHLRQLIITLLREEGYEVLATSDGRDAVKSFRLHREFVDVLLFDLMMPRMNGWEAYSEIARMRPGIPHLFMSGYCNENILPEIAGGRNGTLITKPFSPIYLMTRLEEISTGIRRK